MPKITYLPFDSSYISLSVERAAKRSPGIHLTTILKDMLITAGVERKYGKSLEKDKMALTMEMGFLFERLIAEYIESTENKILEWDAFVKTGLTQITEDDIEASRGALVRPGEQCLDGIFMTPDAVNLKLWHVEEWKATAIRSTNFSFDKRPEWLWQGAAYAKVFGMNRVIYRIWHYAELPATIQQIVVEWTPEEIEQNWNNIRSHHTVMLSRIAK